MRLLSTIFATIVSLQPVLGLAQQASTTRSDVPSTTISPCPYWQYDSNTFGYLCRSYPQDLDVVEAADMQEIVSRLEQRIADLEERLHRLESAK